jgi:hypothetical protein
MERLVQLARQAFKEMSEQQEQLESKVMSEPQELLEILGPRVLLVLVERWDITDHFTT